MDAFESWESKSQSTKGEAQDKCLPFEMPEDSLEGRGGGTRGVREKRDAYCKIRTRNVSTESEEFNHRQAGQKQGEEENKEFSCISLQPKQEIGTEREQSHLQHRNRNI